MNDKQKQFSRALLNLIEENGAHFYPISFVAKQAGLTESVEEIYDNNTNTGLLWSYGNFGNGYLRFERDSVCAPIDTRNLLIDEVE
jgi:hypothetical protein